jgi:hypothetical protein
MKGYMAKKMRFGELLKRRVPPRRSFGDAKGGESRDEKKEGDLNEIIIG